MRAIVAAIRSVVLLATLLGAAAASPRPPVDQLVMFQQAGCPYCAAWDAEVGKIYLNTDESKLLPLRRVDIHAKRPADLSAIQGVVFTPTFVVMHCGREVQRIVGYGGKELFWELLDIAVQKVRAQETSCRGSVGVAPASR